MNDDPISTRRVTLLPETPRTVLSPEEQALVTTGAPLVVRAANRLGARYADLVGQGELVSEGNAGLLAAARSYDPARGPFGAHAFRYIVSRIRKAIRGQIEERRRYREVFDGRADGASFDRYPATPSSQRGAATAGTMANLLWRPCRRSRAGEKTVVEADLRAALRDAIDAAIVELPPMKARLAALYYKESHTLEQAAAVLGIGYATAKRWNGDITAWLRERLRDGETTPVPFSDTGT